MKRDREVEEDEDKEMVEAESPSKRVKVEDEAKPDQELLDGRSIAQVPTPNNDQEAGPTATDHHVESENGADEDDDDDEEEEEEEDEDKLWLPRSTTRSSMKKGTECPYLDTISRQNLDFDFEKCCSVSLSHVNVYVCLVCGKYYQGRGMNTHAYTHSLEFGHHMFMKLDTGRVYCLPDNYEVIDRSLDDIRHVLNPQLTDDELSRLDKSITWARALDGTEYMPGLVGLNNMKNNDYANVVIQILARVPPIRDFFLIPSNYRHCKSLLVQRFGELLRKVWNPRNFKGQVSPHEFMQAVMLSSGKRFIIDRQSDPVEFWSWLVHQLHVDLTKGTKGKTKTSVITDCFQGELQVTTQAGTGRGPAASATEDVVEHLPFMLLGLDLPPTPLFKDALEKNIIPQVPIFHILRKFDGQTVSDDIKAGRRQFQITRLPRYLTLHMKRLVKNQFFVEKNPTIVNFPVKNLELKDLVAQPEDGSAPPSKYDLIANVVHEGKAGEGSYRVHIHRKVEEQWYELQDLHVIDILPQMVALSEAYFQLYELK